MTEPHTHVKTALRHVPMVVKTVAKRGNVPKNWGTLYAVGKIRFLLEQMDLEDVEQEISLHIIDYYGPGIYQNRRLAKLGELEVGESPILGVKAINRALDNKKFDSAREVPIDPSRLPSEILQPEAPEPAWATDLGDKVWELVSKGTLEASEARAWLKYMDLKEPGDWELLAYWLELESIQEAKELVNSASEKISSLLPNVVD